VCAGRRAHELSRIGAAADGARGAASAARDGFTEVASSSAGGDGFLVAAAAEPPEEAADGAAPRRFGGRQVAIVFLR